MRKNPYGRKKARTDAKKPHTASYETVWGLIKLLFVSPYLGRSMAFYGEAKNRLGCDRD